MAEEKPWWGAGYEEAEQAAAAVDARREAGRKGFVNRFWLPVGANDVPVTFVDDDTKPSQALLGRMPPFQLHEHQLHLNGHWRNWYSCLGAGCPLCKAGEKPYFAAVYTIIDHSVWKDKRGEEHKDEKKLFVAKADVLRVIKKMSQEYGGLRGQRFKVSRASENDANVGGVFIPLKRVELPEDVQPFDYVTLLTRKSPEALSALVGQSRKADDEIPF